MRLCLLAVALVGTALAVTHSSGATTVGSRVRDHAHMRAGRSLRTGAALPTGHLTAWQAAGPPGSDARPQGRQTSAKGALGDVGRGVYFAMCLAVKDQHADIREWVLHHRNLGAGKFYIFDNNSTTPMLPVIVDMVDSGLIEYHLVREMFTKRRPQLHIYDTCLQKFGRRHRWMAFTDADEFLVLRNSSLGGSMPVLLQEYEDFGALAVNWQMFGSSGLLERPDNGTLASYFKCLPREHQENLHIKTIANTERVLHAGPDPHTFIYADGYFAVNENRERVDGARTTAVSIEKVALYHYAVKSLAEYQNKIRRGSAMGNQKTIHFFRFIEQGATDNCTDALALG